MKTFNEAYYAKIEIEEKIWNLEVFLLVCPYDDKNRKKYVRLLNIFKIRLNKLK